MASFPATLVTPEKVVFEAEVQSVMLRTEEGEAAFLPGHTALIGALVPGLVRFQYENGTEERAAVHGGFVQVEPDRVVVLAPIAELAGDIDVGRAQRDLEEAERRLAQLGGRSGPADEAAGEGGLERAEAADAERRARVRLEVAGGA
jgi:F-type H+-transporting ATPase subunit epsilon